MKTENSSLRGGKGVGTVKFPITLPLYQGYGSHYFEVYVGSPFPQRQTLLVDTGSDYIAIPCSQCKDCGSHLDEVFNEQNSHSFQQIACPEDEDCEIKASYAEGSSWKGVLVHDVVHLGRVENHNVNFDSKFVCMESNNNEFRRQLANGIVGMNASPRSFPNQFFSSGATSRKSFSICYRQDLYISRRGTIAGAITFGGVDKRLYGEGKVMKYANLFTRNGFYIVNIRKIWFHTEGSDNLFSAKSESELPGASGNFFVPSEAILDSGTTDTLLDISYKELFDDAWKQWTGSNFPSDEVHIPPEELKLWPTIIIQLEGAFTNEKKRSDTMHNASSSSGSDVDDIYRDDVLVVLHPYQYMKFSLSSKSYRPQISFHDEYESRSILGSNFMDGSLIEFDVENQRIGFVESECDYIHVTSGKHSANMLDPYASREEMNMYLMRSILVDSCSSNHTQLFILCAILSLIYFIIPKSRSRNDCIVKDTQ